MLTIHSINIQSCYLHAQKGKIPSDNVSKDRVFEVFSVVVIDTMVLFEVFQN